MENTSNLFTIDAHFFHHTAAWFVHSFIYLLVFNNLMLIRWKRAFIRCSSIGNCIQFCIIASINRFKSLFTFVHRTGNMVTVAVWRKMLNVQYLRRTFIKIFTNERNKWEKTGDGRREREEIEGENERKLNRYQKFAMEYKLN